MSTYIFGLIVFPYVTRVLGVDMWGRVNFADQAVYYLRILAAMGVATVGVREIAACGDDRARRSQVFSDIFSFILIVALGALVLLLVLVYTVPRFTEVKDLLLVGSFYLLFSSLMIEWFYQGTENFKYVTIRSVAVKTLYVISVFLLVKKPEDYLLYYILTTAVVVVNAAINIGYSRHSVSFSLRRAHPFRYAGSLMALGVYTIMLSFFTTFNVVFLGFTHSEHDVGIYTTAIKIYMIILGFLTAFSSVMLPRMASLLSENKVDEFKSKVHKSFDFVFAFSPPLVAGGVVLAPQIISVLAGEEYLEAVLPMRMVMPLVIVVGLGQVWVTQVLMPMMKDRVVLYSAISAAIIGVALNIILVPGMSFLGSAIAILASEIVNNTITLVYALRKGYLAFPVGDFLKAMLTFIPYAAICMGAALLIKNVFICLGAAFLVCLLLFVLINRCRFQES